MIDKFVFTFFRHKIYINCEDPQTVLISCLNKLTGAFIKHVQYQMKNAHTEVDLPDKVGVEFCLYAINVNGWINRSRRINTNAKTNEILRVGLTDPFPATFAYGNKKREVTNNIYYNVIQEVLIQGLATKKRPCHDIISWNCSLTP